jgi:hypothetical protein
VYTILCCILPFTDSSGVQAGGIFVNEEARKLVVTKFRLAKVTEANVLPMQELEEGFENGKKEFADPRTDNIKLRVGMTKLNIDSINVRRGVLTLEGYATKSFLFNCFLGAYVQFGPGRRS